jgi:Domain of unknown function (DUF5666)
MRTTVIAAAAAGLIIVGGGLALATTAAGASSSSSPSGYGPGGNGERPSGAKSTGTDQPPAPKRTPHLMGTVKSVSGSTILITDQDGFTRTIKVSGSTKYEDSLTANPAAGTKIAAEGTVDSDGTSLDATTVSAAKMMPGGPGGHGPGGGPGGQNGGRGQGNQGGSQGSAPAPSTSPTS